MARDALQGFLRLGMWVAVCGLVMIFMQEPGSAGFVLSVCSAAIGLAIIMAVVVVMRVDYLGWLARLAARRAPQGDSPPDVPPIDPSDPAGQA